ncbi:hypothetical protein AAFF_G00236560 [Aldrovandia affinis]|uniref:CCHC-type domain-containing protein n=1 Tax=Aldrovandia affinis TaxID=143900 RepID=A0AAD7REB5_9TELE|nr:hypothetical protein AAFF_G00236560 [Aldrovandia affinis]
MKAYFQVCKVPEEDQVEVLKQHLKGEAKFTVKLKLESGAKSVDKIFLALKEVYGDKTPIGVRLREFYDRRQAAGEKVKAYAYDLQDKLNQLKAQDSTRVPDIDVMLKEQFVIGLRDDTLRREMKKEVKEKPTQTFSALMQAAIDWCEEEETTQDPSSKNQVRGAVHVAQAVDPPTALSLQSLHDNIQKIAAHLEELFRAMQGASDRQGRPRRTPLKDDEGQLICYTCSEPGHTSRTCPRTQGKDGGGPVCYACGQPGHTSRTCRRGQGEQPKNNSIASDISGQESERPNSCCCRAAAAAEGQEDHNMSSRKVMAIQAQKRRPKGKQAHQAAQAAVKGHFEGNSWEDLQRLQSQDPEVGPVIAALRAGNRPCKAPLREMSRAQRKLVGQWDRLELQRGVLFRCLQDPRNGDDVRQLIVPELLQ